MKRSLFVMMLALLLALSACNLQMGNDAGLDEPAVSAGSSVQNGGASDPRAPQPEQPSVPEAPALAPEDGRVVIFYNGTVLTMNEAQPVAEALAIQGNVILAVGSQDEVLAYQTDDTVMVDLQGRTLMPGFVDGHSHMFTQNDQFGGIQAVQEQVLAEGITTMADMGGGRGEIIDQLREMEANGELRMRVSMYLNQVSVCGEDFGYWYENFTQTIAPGALVHIPGVKIFLDGGACNRIARTAGDPGDLYFTLEEAIQILSDIEERGFQAAVHALGDRAVDQALAAFSAVIGASGNPMRHRIEHNASVRPDQIPLYNEIKPVAMIFGGSAACWWSGASDQWGEVGSEYLDWEWPSQALIEANPEVVFAWHEDVPIFPLGSIEQLWGFVTRKQLAADGSVCEPPDFALAGAIPVETALEVMTINAAYALHRDHEVGSLEVGKLADLIILSDNPLTVPPDDLINLEVQATLVNGNTEYCASGMEALCP